MFGFSTVPHYERCHLHLTLLNSHYECMTGIIQSQWDCVSIELIQIARYDLLEYTLILEYTIKLKLSTCFALFLPHPSFQMLILDLSSHDLCLILSELELISCHAHLS